MCLVIITLDASKSDEDEVGPPPAKITKRSSGTKSEGQCVLYVHNNSYLKKSPTTPLECLSQWIEDDYLLYTCKHLLTLYPNTQMEQMTVI